MADIASFWDVANARGDWQIDGADLVGGSDLETAVLISLFTDARADADEIPPDGTNNRRGWWGDAGAPVPLGSKLWLLDRSKKTEQVRMAAQDYIQAALQWLLDNGVAASVDVTTQWQTGGPANRGFLAAQVVITEPSASQTQVFNYQWAWGSSVR